MTRFLIIGAMVAGTAVLAAPETAKAEHCSRSYSRVGYGSGYYAPRSYSYRSPRLYGGGYGYGHHHHRRHYRGHHNHGRFGFGVRTRRFSFGYHR